MVITAKLSKRKLTGLLLVVLVCALSLALFITGCSDKDEQNLTSNEERVAYLQSLGWQVSTEPLKTQQVSIPEQMNDILVKYNDLQLQQGFDLTQHLGASATRYVYQVSNYPNAPGEVFATLLIRDDKLIAADLTCWDSEGFCRPLLAAGN